MYLKRLDVAGFKSFADTIHLDFEPGITGIVGPNGCGKSNIIDATRWCLGEMSAKSLRSSAMMDVVFNGSGSRPPQNLSDVTLTFDNSDKRLPIDYSEVSITRRLFRSGESEYFINKTQCRLRDIKELFLDTGMGEDGYYSMEQGRVEWILSAKPEERRELFEEAAGVSKYRARREEALRKLERVDIDLSRLADIISVTSDQIKKLENAVNKAKTYERIRDDLRSMEISDWLVQMNAGDEELKLVQERLAAAQKNAEELNTRVHQVNAELSEFRLTLTQTEEELLGANSVLNAIDADIKIGEERQANARQREQELTRQVQNVTENFQRELNRIAELEEQLKGQVQAVEELKADGAKIELEFSEAQTSFNFTLEQLEEKKKNVKGTRDLILDRAQERARLQQQTGTFSSDVTRLESQAENMAREMERAKINLEEAVRSMEAAELQKNELTRQLAEKSALLSAATEQMTRIVAAEQNLDGKVLSSAEEIAKLKGQIHSIRDQQSQDPYLAGAQAILSSGLPGISGPVGRLIQCADGDRDIVAATIGEHLADLAADAAEDAQRAIDFLRENERGRVRIWILDRVAPLGGTSGDSATVGHLPEATRLSARLQCAPKFEPLIASLCASSWIEGSTVYGRAVINGGIDPSKWKSHVTHRLPELESLLEKKETEKAALEAQHVQLEQDQSAFALRRESAIKEMEEVRIRLELQNEEIERFSRRNGVIQEERRVIDIELTHIKDDKVKATQQLEEAMGRFQALQTREKEDHDQLDLLQQELTELQHVHAKANAELSAKQERHKDFQDKMNWQNSILDHSTKELSAVHSSAERHRESATHFAAEIDGARIAQSDAKTLIGGSLSKRQEAAQACAAIQEKRVRLAETIKASDTHLSQLRSELSAAQESAQGELIRETTIKSRAESLTQKLFDQYEFTVETARRQFAAQVADAEALDRLKKRVANIGPINLAAPQEHAELSEKNNFLVAQQSDLLKAKDDLRQVITKINATTREHFRETFDKVRENFRLLYSKLFQGGEADLRFTDETDILNTGVDIFCQPPGKKLLHISLLSGGEKALTAIALLFAFFQVRPSPITLLDEVDAPLDEANVLRYVEMIKLFSEKSQFLLITHNKRTMEAANCLYGVTMEELGVSKVLSARLQKKESAAPQRSTETAAV